MRFIGFLHKRLLSLFCIAAAVLAVLFWIVPPVVLSTQADTPRFQEPVCRVDTKEKQIALTFDVEWTDVQTNELLNILKKYQATATFFVVGHWAETHNESVLRITMAGCELGTHSMTHVRMDQLSRWEQKEELQASSRVLEQITGKQPRLFRAPYGAYSPELLSTVREEGMVSIQWEIDSLDWKNISPERICDHIVQQVRPGAIVRFQSSALNTPTALEKVLEVLCEQGYTFVTVTELMDKG